MAKTFVMSARLHSRPAGIIECDVTYSDTDKGKRELQATTTDMNQYLVDVGDGLKNGAINSYAMAVSDAHILFLTKRLGVRGVCRRQGKI